MMRIAVIGSGISGLSAAYYLSRKHQVWLFEKDSRLGGHTHTVTVESSQGPLQIDTGFIVHNDRTYPNLIKLFAELGVATQPSDMSFAVMDRASGYEYSSRGLGGFFAQPSNILSRDQYYLLREILRFNCEAPRLLDQLENNSLTLGDVIDQGRYSTAFTERYLYPMASAVWSMSTKAIRTFPAFTLLRFFQNHGMLGINTHPKWRVVRGGSNQYLAPISKPFAERIQLGVEISSISRAEECAKLHFKDRPDASFDQVVFACHGNQVLPLLESPTDNEREVLANFTTSRNDVCLHTDCNLLALRPRARASWNYNLNTGDGGSATVTYHMNRLQSLTADEDYCVTLNPTASIRPEKILRHFVYHHPIYTRAAIQAQSRWSTISGHNRTHYCGAYWFNGFHEDGLNSALRVARALGVEA
ncbi:MAG: FAD-dependent oxidoreductase [Acidobacteriota bacterium]